jgi:MFS family permease
MREEPRLLEFRRSLSAGLATSALRRLQCSWAASALGSWTFFVALAVYAYGVGGAAGVGAAALVRMIPAGLAAPGAGVLADRHSRRDVLMAALVLRAGIVASIAGAVAISAPFGVVLVLAAAFTVVATAHRPAQAALLTGLAETPRQLGAANALWTGVDNAAFLGGSLVGGALIAVVGVAAALAATAVIFALAVIPTAAIPRDPVPEYRAAMPRRLSALTAGLRDVAAVADVRLVVGFLTTATLIEGAVDVLIVVLAIELLDLGNAGVGWLNAAWGLGGLLGGGAALGLLGRGRLSAGIMVGGLLVGASLVVVATVLSPVLAIVMLVGLGIGYALIEAGGMALLQRATPDEVLGRVFAVVETTYWVATGVGAMLAPLVVALVGARGAVLAIGACLPLAVALRWRALSRLEEHAVVPEDEFRVLRGLSVFAPLPLATVENLARHVGVRPVHAGEVVVRRGDAADEFYAVAEGVLDVSDCGGTPPPLRAGDFFGEIALLHECARIATVTAREEALLYALERDVFLNAISAHPRSSAAAHETATARLEENLAAQTGSSA